ncbi:MAG: hypothetical protein AUJ75_03300 [Candidatus Omnitrophica bacterium CG1_02_49_10]|nr:MAG: hypothetical protein AUJ75_03300 [Candidatus Omnitrophica bacterium CG1_02_49_10]
MELSLLSSYHQLGYFLNKIESGPWLFEVSDIEISAGEGEPLRHSVRLLVNIFVSEDGDI